MYRLAEMRFTELQEFATTGRTLAILAVGAVEEHGAHLPLGLDAFAAEAYAEAAAPLIEDKGYTIILAPPVFYGVARQALKFPGTLTLEPDTLRMLILDVGRSLSTHGLGRLVILNGHRELSHMTALEQAARELVEEGALLALCVGFTTDPAVTAACFREGVRGLSRSQRPEREGHGGEWETSLALHRFPELVNTKVIPELEPNFDYDADAFRDETKDYWILSSGKGYFGSPGSASAETGRELLQIRGHNIARVILKALGTPKERPS